MERGAIVIGSGFAGLGTAAALKRQGMPARVLERADAVGASWRGRYDSLRLNTLRWLSTAAGYRMPRRYGRWPAREELIEYLEEYVRRMDLEVDLGVEATRIDRDDGGWRVETSAGEREADVVVVATGWDRIPFIPDWPGRESFPGQLLHAAAYRNPEPFRGKDVLVVSAGNTGSEVACELIRNGAARVRNAMRTPPNIFRREWGGVPLNLVALTGEKGPMWMADLMGRGLQRAMYGDLTSVGLPASPVGFATSVKVRHVAPMIDAGFVDEVKAGRIGIVPAVTAFDGPDVVLADGSRVQPDVVIAATGYRRGLEPLVGHLAVLDEAGDPAYNGAPTHPATPGLYFNGFRVRLSCQLGLMRIEARRIARDAARLLTPSA